MLYAKHDFSCIGGERVKVVREKLPGVLDEQGG